MNDFYEGKHKKPSESDRGNVPYENTLETKGVKTVPNQNNDPDRGIGAIDNAVRFDGSRSAEKGGDDSKKI
jgi:hypothetical protein